MNKLLKWATEIDSIAQAGLTYSKDVYDIDRFNQLKNIAADIISESTNLELHKVKEVLFEERGYLTPKVDVRAAIIKENKILLVKEKLDGTWSLPGGWADINLSVSENIKKEAYEEAGAKVEPKSIIAILDRNKHNKPLMFQSIYKIFILCDLLDVNFNDNIETETCGFFELDNLPKLSLTRNTKEQIEMCFEAYNNQSFKPKFD
ncbi:NUDIX hydrolase N-terminal domain-containing protein [Clostridium perfringens]|uniref:NUDIX hydrolase N-terminal domain-containing protein n=1 Tax=Clostridium perfringens TaxID=1502 RepID=UPI0013E2CBA1|nr:NUDIX hydrolase [Clostridium perfringens]MCC5421901.1 NUDIX hydrolase [Clostridium perfringens]MCC5431363.1 NUDIX hydrolase [Clostridium perfringens]MCC5445888.1 NUDIX hydrolase [Clostridium perfringens]MCC5449340.1 NUDIX hydrolase [Clostridium perfringens]NGT59096.1 NUDIX hydrolase [Clostridium perfringens]